MTDNEYRRLSARSPREAQNALFNEYFGYVYTIVFNRLRSCAAKEDIEECISDVFADTFVYLGSDTDKNGSIRSFISTVAIRKSINMYRSLSAKSGRTVSIEEGSTDRISDSTDIADSAERAELRDMLLRLIEELGEPDSTMIIQKYYYGMTSKEIAKAVSLDPAAVRVRCSRAIRRLRDRLSESDISIKEAE